ncbi:MAG: PAS domain S-box protein [bacterium]|nr:PAS domain S-box protein [bacterium]
MNEDNVKSLKRIVEKLEEDKAELKRENSDLYRYLHTDVDEDNIGNDNNSEMWKLILDNIPQRIFWKDKDFVYLGCNRKFAEDAGFKNPESIIGKTDSDMSWAQDRIDFYRDYDQRIIRGELSDFNFVECVKTLQNDESWININKIPLFDPDGEIKGILTIYEDVTDRKRLEEALKESEKLFFSIVESVPDIIYRLDLEGNITFISSSVKQYGYTPDELTGRNILELVHPEDREKARYRINERRSGSRRTQSFELRLMKKDHIAVPFEIKSNILYEKQPVFLISSEGLYSYDKHDGKSFIGTQGIARDITERKKYMDALKRAENEKTVILNSVSEHVIFHDLELRHIWLNKAALDSTDKSYEELINEKCYESWANRNSACPDCPIKKAVDTGEYQENELKSQDGRVKWIRGYPVHNENRVLTGVVGVTRDITARKNAEKALRESEFRYKELFENMSSGVAVLKSIGGGEDFIFQDINKSAEFIDSIDRKDYLGKSIIAAFPEIENSGLLDALRRVFNSGKPEKLSVFPIDLNQDVGWRENYVYKLPTEEIIIVFDDITEKKRAEEEKKILEEQLFHAQKLESVGRLAGGIAHDFNNILTGITGYSEMLKQQNKNTDSFENQAAEIILKSTERAAALTKQLLGFARKEKFNPISLNVTEIIDDSIKVTEKIFEKNIDVICKFQKKVMPVLGDRFQIENVFTNLFINARDAMPAGGEITIKVEGCVIDKKYTMDYPEFQKGEYVKIIVSDTGSGIPEEIRENIFDPFFTTKEEGKGTGLGLATVYSIIKNHNGYINVKSETNTGTTFNIFLPVSEKTITDRVETSAEMVKGVETILVVDDEIGVRNLIKIMLEFLGYTVLMAEDGQKAIEIYKEKYNDVDLVILDMIMPNLAGKETFYKLKKINNDIKVILLSGFSQEGKASELLNNGALSFISKPFKMQQLSEVINKCVTK